MRRKGPRQGPSMVLRGLLKGYGDRHRRAGETLAFGEIPGLLRRVGEAPQDRLAWAVALIQRPRGEMTPGDRENLKLELVAFSCGESLADFVKATGDLDPGDHVALRVPPEKKVREILECFGDMIGKAVRRENIERQGKEKLILFWDSRAGRYDEWLDRLVDPDTSERALWALLRQYGHLVKECPATAVRAKAGETCGVWFVAKRPNQDYCSATCQSRAATRATRAATVSVPARLRAKRPRDAELEEPMKIPRRRKKRGSEGGTARTGGAAR